MYASSGNKHFFTKSCHHQTYQNYEQPPRTSQNLYFLSHFSVLKIGQIFPKNFFYEKLEFDTKNTKTGVLLKICHSRRENQNPIGNRTRRNQVPAELKPAPRSGVNFANISKDSLIVISYSNYLPLLVL